jgi:hypothetical protein
MFGGYARKKEYAAARNRENAATRYVCLTLTCFTCSVYLLYLLTAALCAGAARDALHLTRCRVACFSFVLRAALNRENTGTR